MRKGYTVTYQMRKKQRQQREIVIQYVLKFVGVVLLAFLLVRFVCFSFTIQGDSMSPTIERGEKHLVNRLIYQIKGPSRYDVVIFKSDDKNGNYYVKRVIGLPGEKVQIKNGRIYVNGKKTKVIAGTSYEEVLDSYYDIVGAILELRKLGYKNIYLQGHSLGCTKIIYTYNKLKKQNNTEILEMIKSIILLSLVDITSVLKVFLGKNFS